MVTVWVTNHEELGSAPMASRPPAPSSSSSLIPHVVPSNSASEVSRQYAGRSETTRNSTVSDRSPSRPRTSTRGSTIRPESASRPMRASASAPGSRGPIHADKMAIVAASAMVAGSARDRRRVATATIAVVNQSTVTSRRCRSSPTIAATANTTDDGTSASPRPAARKAKASASTAAAPTARPATKPKPVANSRGGVTSPNRSADSPMRAETSVQVRPSGRPNHNVSRTWIQALNTYTNAN